MSPESSPLDGLRRAAEELAVEVSSLVPRLVDRSRAQLSIAMSFAERLPCAGWFGLGAETASPRPDLRVVDGFDEEDDLDLAPAHVALVPDPSAPGAPAPTKTAAARKVAAAKATAEAAPAEKTAPKKAAAKKAGPKKAAAKAAPKQAAAKHAPPKQAAPEKAAAKKQASPKKAGAKKVAAKKVAAKKAPPQAVAPMPAPRDEAPVLVPDPAAPAPGGLAVPDYDELAASQVIPRLDSLSPAELESIRLHEAAHRSRRTILSRIAQIQAG